MKPSVLCPSTSLPSHNILIAFVLCLLRDHQSRSPPTQTLPSATPSPISMDPGDTERPCTCCSSEHRAGLCCPRAAVSDTTSVRFERRTSHRCEEDETPTRCRSLSENGSTKTQGEWRIASRDRRSRRWRVGADWYLGRLRNSILSSDKNGQSVPGYPAAPPG